MVVQLTNSTQTQSTRGENRPGSQGFGSAPGGSSGGPAPANFGPVDGSNNILPEGSEHDPSSYGIYGASAGHNGSNGPEY